ncbi:MAG: PhzF family phenazine biosynthesis protein [Cyanobacteria bacterium P01_G01_bin.49]
MIDQYQFYTADVFTDQIFGGNPLAVFPTATELTSQQMQKIAAEFNYSETVFVLPPETPKGTRKLRIFTPATELPFAGHPTVGTAYILVAIGEITGKTEDFTIIFEEGVGLVPVTIKTDNKFPTYAELTAAQLPEFQSKTPSISDLASILGLDPQDLKNDHYSPQAVSCGVPFLFVQANNREILGKIQFNRDRWQGILANTWAPSIYVFCFDPERKESHLRSRMFAPSMGILEDPATGAAATALGAYLGIRDTLTDGTLHWRVEQGFEMGRPSILEVFTEKKQDKISKIRVGGASVLVSKGMMNIPS